MTVFAACEFCYVEQRLIECADGKRLCDHCFLERLTHELRDQTIDNLVLVNYGAGYAWLKPESRP